MKKNRFGLAALALAVAAGTAAPAFAGGVPPTLTKDFSPTVITDGGTTVLTFTLTNPAGAPAVSNVGFTDTLPAGLVVAPGSVGGTCANAAAATTATAGTHLITVSNLQVPAGAPATSSTCVVTVAVTNAPGQLNPDCTGNPAAFTNTATGVTVTNAINGVVPSCLTVLGVTPVTSTATNTPTNTPTDTPTNTPTDTPTATPSNTPTTVPPTATATVVTGGGPPLGSIPTLSAGMLALLAVALAGGALFLVRRS